MDTGFKEILATFKQRAMLVGATLYEVKNLEEAFEYIVEICVNKDPVEILAQDSRRSKLAKFKKTIAAPSFLEEEFNKLDFLCKNKEINCLQQGLSAYLGGIDLGIAKADLGIAASGTCVLDCSNPEKRLATMISEICVLILEVKNIKSDLTETADYLNSVLLAENPSTITYISGPSRTSDIERVLTIGVHGPLELYIILMGD